MKTKRLSILILSCLLLITVMSFSSNKVNAAALTASQELFDFNIGDIVIFSGEAFFTSAGDLPQMINSFGLYKITKKNAGSPYPYAITPLGGKETTGWTSALYLSLYEPDEAGNIFKSKLDANVRNNCSVWNSKIYATLLKDAFVSIYDIIENEGREWGKTINGFYIAMENLVLVELGDKETDTIRLGKYETIRAVQLRDATTNPNKTIGMLYKHETIEILSVFWNETGIRCGKTKYNEKTCYVYMDNLIYSNQTT